MIANSGCNFNPISKIYVYSPLQIDFSLISNETFERMKRLLFSQRYREYLNVMYNTNKKKLCNTNEIYKIGME